MEYTTYLKQGRYKTAKNFYTIDPEIDFDFDFVEKGLGIVLPLYFVHDFSRKMFLKLYIFY